MSDRQVPHEVRLTLLCGQCRSRPRVLAEAYGNGGERIYRLEPGRHATIDDQAAPPYPDMRDVPMTVVRVELPSGRRGDVADWRPDPATEARMLDRGRGRRLVLRCHPRNCGAEVPLLLGRLRALYAYAVDHRMTEVRLPDDLGLGERGPVSYGRRRLEAARSARRVSRG
jgi:hypothetical protein